MSRDRLFFVSPLSFPRAFCGESQCVAEFRVKPNLVSTRFIHHAGSFDTCRTHEDSIDTWNQPLYTVIIVFVMVAKCQVERALFNMAAIQHSRCRRDKNDGKTGPGACVKRADHTFCDSVLPCQPPCRPSARGTSAEQTPNRDRRPEDGRHHISVLNPGPTLFDGLW